ncbi:hypothetical protein BGX30_013548, partial [Mortierella sp. GBA39]
MKRSNIPSAPTTYSSEATTYNPQQQGVHCLLIIPHCAKSLYYNDELGSTTTGAIDPDYAVSIEVYTPSALYVAKYAIQQHMCAYGGEFNQVKSSVTAKAND